jgi:hypothetical protein
MTAPKHALLLVGSPKGLKQGSSARLGGLLFDHLEKRGIKIDALHIHAALLSRDPQILRRGVSGADLVVLATPLYVDSLPAPVIWAMEQLATEKLPEQLRTHPRRFAALINCGFPEPSQNATCAGICQQFAQSVGFEWAGALIFGTAGAPTRRVRRAIELAAVALAAGGVIPEEACLSKPVVPPWLYPLTNFTWKLQARNRGKRKNLRATPYA